MTQKALVDEGLNGVEIGVCDLFSRVERAAAAEDCEPSKDASLVLRQKVVAPFDGGAQGLLARIDTTPRLEQVEFVAETLEQLLGA